MLKHRKAPNLLFKNCLCLPSLYCNGCLESAAVAILSYCRLPISTVQLDIYPNCSETQQNLRNVTRTYVRGPGDSGIQNEVPFQRVSVQGIHVTGVRQLWQLLPLLPYLTLRPLIQADIPKFGSLPDRIPKSDRKIDAVCFCDLGTTSDMIG